MLRITTRGGNLYQFPVRTHAELMKEIDIDVTKRRHLKIKYLAHNHLIFVLKIFEKHYTEYNKQTIDFLHVLTLDGQVGYIVHDFDDLKDL